MLHISLALELLAFVAGVALLIYIKNQAKVKSLWLNFVAWFVIIISALCIICSGYYLITCCSRGECPYRMMQKNMKEMKYNKSQKNY
ncbi:MAG: hypothetical protein JW769_02125 [Parachlamydiales bacterium]|nr:hypothetical protein [Parachlamydiales bacterium]